MTEDGRSPELRYAENGASWWWLLAGPLAAVAMVWVQFRAGLGVRPTVPLMFLVLVTAGLALQVKAARVHTGVELTSETLREGIEVLPVREIVEIFPEPDYTVKAPGFMDNWRGRPLGSVDTGLLEPWQSARTLGALSGVPKRRTPVGLRLTGGRYVQAWARHPDALRAELARLCQAGPE